MWRRLFPSSFTNLFVPADGVGHSLEGRDQADVVVAAEGEGGAGGGERGHRDVVLGAVRAHQLLDAGAVGGVGKGPHAGHLFFKKHIVAYVFASLKKQLPADQR